MNSLQRRASLDDVLAAVGVVTDQIKVPVSAVDDLGCEIEWQARRASGCLDASDIS